MKTQKCTRRSGGQVCPKAKPCTFHKCTKRECLCEEEVTND